MVNKDEYLKVNYLIVITVCRLDLTRLVYDEKRLVFVGSMLASCTTGFMCM